MRLRPFPAILITVPLLLSSDDVRAISADLLHDFEDGTRQQWGGNQTGTIENVADGGPAGEDDGYLQTNVSSFHLGAKNSGDWSGDYVSAGVQAIEMDLNYIPRSDQSGVPDIDPYSGPSQVPTGDADPSIQIRILIFGAGGTFASVQRTPILAANEWTHHSFGLTTNDFIYLEGGTGVLDDTLRNVTTLLIRNDTAIPTTPGEHPPHITASLGIDNVQAVGDQATQPTTGNCDVFESTASSLPLETRLRLANPGSNIEQRSFIRFVNDNDLATSVELYGTDDAGHYTTAIGFVMPADTSMQITAQDLEAGSNPASNTSQRSSLRLVNNSDAQGSVTISAIDDMGTAAPNGNVTFDIIAESAMSITAADLENGNSALGLAGSLGDGTGKWRLRISSDVDLQVQSLLETSTGFLTNLSRPSED